MDDLTIHAEESPSALLGAAGEHYVMCQLLRLNFIAALAPAGVPLADILITDRIGDQASAIQVKTRRELGTDGGWHMKSKHEDIRGERLFYVFVSFAAASDVAPETYILPSDTVADVLRESHQTWLAAVGKNGRAHKDGPLRRFLPDYLKMKLDIGRGAGWLEPYRNNWELLRAS